MDKDIHKSHEAQWKKNSAIFKHLSKKTGDPFWERHLACERLLAEKCIET